MAGLGGIPQYEKKTEAVSIAHVKQNCIYGDVTMEGACEWKTKTEITGDGFLLQMVQRLVAQRIVHLEAVGETFKDARSAAQDRAAAHEISCDAHRAALTEHCLQSVARYASPTPLCASFPKPHGAKADGKSLSRLASLCGCVYARETCFEPHVVQVEVGSTAPRMEQLASICIVA